MGLVCVLIPRKIGSFFGGTQTYAPDECQIHFVVDGKLFYGIFKKDISISRNMYALFSASDRYYPVFYRDE